MCEMTTFVPLPTDSQPLSRGRIPSQPELVTIAQPSLFSATRFCHPIASSAAASRCSQRPIPPCSRTRHGHPHSHLRFKLRSAGEHQFFFRSHRSNTFKWLTATLFWLLVDICSPYSRSIYLGLSPLIV